MSKNVENFEQKWLPVGHFESDVIGNITTRCGKPKKNLVRNKNEVSISICFELMSKNVEYYEQKWLPDGQFEFFRNSKMTDIMPTNWPVMM